MSLVLPFDTDDPEFGRGVEVGIVWTHLDSLPPVTQERADHTYLITHIGARRRGDRHRRAVDRLAVCHQLPLKHVLSNRGDLGQLLNHGGGPVKGDMITVCNTGSGSGCAFCH